MKNKNGFNSTPGYSGHLSAIILLGLFGLTTACGNIKQLQYLQGPLDTAALAEINFVEPVIQKGDILNITVYSDNQLASSLYNQGGGVGGTGTSVPSSNVAGLGYLVSQEGFIRLYEIGPVRVEGLSRKQLADFLAQQYLEKNLLKNPFVEVRFLNFKVTVIGDVGSPGVYNFTVDKVSIFDAIGMAGDLTGFAKRNNVLVVREANGVRRFSRLDLTDPNVFNSPFYYLQQNDMIVVDPTKQKANMNDQTFRYISIGTSIVSIVAIIYSFFDK